MDSARELGKFLLVIGIVIACVGALLLSGVRLPFRLGRLPGDIVVQGRNSSFYFPIVTCIGVSVVLTLLMWIVNFFRRGSHEPGQPVHLDARAARMESQRAERAHLRAAGNPPAGHLA